MRPAPMARDASSSSMLAVWHTIRSTVTASLSTAAPQWRSKGALRHWSEANAINLNNRLRHRGAGNVTITQGNTSITVTHGLDVTPALTDIAVTSNSSLLSNEILD